MTDSKRDPKQSIWTKIKNSLPYRLWMKFAHILGRINTTILMSLFYLIFIGIGKVGSFIARKDLLDSKWKDRESYWRKRENFSVTKENLLKPY